MGIPAVLALENGTVFRGESIGADGSTVGEVVFNTSMTGYQEILTDPSYAKQLVTLTYPHIGNVGTNSADEESGAVMAAGLIIRDLSITVSSWRSEDSLMDYLRRQRVVGIAGIDTRKLTRILRETGALNGCIMAGVGIDEQVAIAAAKAFPGLVGMDLAKEVTTLSPYTWNQGSWSLEDGLPGEPRKAELQQIRKQQPYHVVAYDYGVKRNILRILVDKGCKVSVVPATTPAEDVLAMNPDGVFLSNGPGDPEPCDYAITAIRKLLAVNVPLFGICLGHQLLALAAGARTVKMKFGHHGGNHPVEDLATKRVMISSQNHCFAVDEKTLPAHLCPTHRSLFDNTLQGVHHTEKPAFAFQGHPEASPGPHDVGSLFDHFVELMKQSQEGRRAV